MTEEWGTEPIADNLTEVADRLLTITTITRGEILNYFNRDSCVASVRILSHVLDYFGHPSKPLPVKLMVWTRVGWDMNSRGVPIEEWPEDGWSVGIAGTGAQTVRTTPGETRARSRWDGHLVNDVYAHGHRWMLDPSMDQLARPKKGIFLNPSTFGIPDDFAPDCGYTLRFERDNGLVVMYECMPYSRAWESATDWTEHEKEVRRIAGDAIRLLRKEIPRSL